MMLLIAELTRGGKVGIGTDNVGVGFEEEAATLVHHRIKQPKRVISGLASCILNRNWQCFNFDLLKFILRLQANEAS